ncbi:MAG: glycosyltransferase family 2 protein [Xanthomonadales bacterium]|nr:glycosyltransferase family 2 protein [Xanthomonadales bacterium]
MDLSDITPVMLSFNEAPNIGRSLGALGRFDEIVLVDSGSSDETLELAGRHPGVRVFARDFDTHGGQWNFAVQQARTRWVLSLDADYRIDSALLSEIEALADSDVAAYYAPFRYWVLGQPLRRSILPPRAILFQPARCGYVDDGHTQRLRVDGPTGTLANPVHHDDRKPLSRWLWAQGAYARLEAQKLADDDELSRIDRIRRRKWIAPFAVFLHVFFVQRGFLDGWRGFYYAIQRMIAEAILSLEVLERELDET